MGMEKYLPFFCEKCAVMFLCDQAQFAEMEGKEVQICDFIKQTLSKNVFL